MRAGGYCGGRGRDDGGGTCGGGVCDCCGDCCCERHSLASFLGPGDISLSMFRTYTRIFRYLLVGVSVVIDVDVTETVVVTSVVVTSGSLL